MLQRLRLRYQLRAARSGAARRPTSCGWTRLSPIDRSIITQAVREIAGVQRRMDNMSAYADPESWTLPDRS